MRILKEIGNTISVACQVLNAVVMGILPYAQAFAKTGQYIESEVDSMIAETKETVVEQLPPPTRRKRKNENNS